MHSTVVTTVLGRRGRGALAATLAATVGVTGALANDAQAAQPPPRCATMACPDLVMDGGSDGSTFTAGWVYVKNIGGFRARLSTLVMVDRPGTGPSDVYLYVPPLDPGQRYRAALPRCIGGSGGDSGDQWWTFHADAHNSVEESSETNNSDRMEMEC